MVGVYEISRRTLETLLTFRFMFCLAGPLLKTDICTGDVTSIIFNQTSHVDPVCVDLISNQTNLFAQVFFHSIYFRLILSKLYYFICVSQSFKPLLTANLPDTTSIKTLIHYGQLVKSNRFCQFDNGEYANKKSYGSAIPPDYDLTKITTPTALYYSVSDSIAAAKDVARLPDKLPNNVEYYRVDDNTFTHFDFTLAPDAQSFVYDHVIATMQTSENSPQ